MTIHHIRRISFLLLLMTLLAACGGEQSAVNPSEAEPVRISVSGAFALFPIVTVWTEEYSKLHPNVTFDVQAGGGARNFIM